MPVSISGTSGITNVDGSAGTPAEKGSTSATAGMFFPAANTVAFSTSSTEAMRIDSSQKVGIGTSSIQGKFNVGSGRSFFGANSETYSVGVGYTQARVNAGQVYYIGGTDATAPDLVFSNSAGTERMRVTDAGNVGISGNGGNATNRLSLTYSGGSGEATIGPNSNGGSTFLTFGTSNSGTYAERARFTSAGSFYLGTTINTAVSCKMAIAYAGGGTEYGMEFKPSADNAYALYFLNAAGSGIGGVSNSSTATTYNTSSDYRLKHTVAPLTTGLATVSALKPVTYKWTADDSDGEGFIAHELAEVIPLAVTGEKDAVNEDGSIKPQGVDYSKIVVHLVAAIQEQQAQIEELKAKVAALEAKP